MNAEMTTAARIISIIIVIIPLIILVAIIYHFLKGPIARIGMMKNIKTAHGTLMFTLPAMRSVTGAVSDGYSISSSGEFFSHYHTENFSYPCGLRVLMMLEEKIDGKLFLEMYGLPHDDQEDPFKKYPHYLHQGTVCYVTDRKGTNYYIDFVPDPIYEQGAVRGTVAWYKKQKFG